MVQAEHQQFYPKPGWVEHDPLEILATVQRLLSQLFDQTPLSPGDILAVGLTNQRETVVAWDRISGTPLYPAIVWQDQRTEALCRSHPLRDAQEWIRQKTGLPLSSYFSATKIRWLLDAVPAVQSALAKGTLAVGTMDSWLLWNLTGGVHATDPSNASRTLLMDLDTLSWDTELAALFGIPLAILPEIRSSAEQFGIGQGVLEGIPIAGILGDQQAALLGQACVLQGDTKNTYGTGCFLLTHAGNQRPRSAHGLITTVAFKHAQHPTQYALEGSVAVTGALVQWLRDNLGLIDRTCDIEALALTVPDSAGLFVVPAFSGLYAPYWRSDARGLIIGLTGYAQKGHLARAVLEATAYQTRDLIEALSQDLGQAVTGLKVDGGMTVNQTLMQFQADILGFEVTRSAVPETTARGAAFAAGLALGIYSDPIELKRLWREKERYAPQMPAAIRDQKYGQWKKAVDRSMGWTIEETSFSPEGGTWSG